MPRCSGGRIASRIMGASEGVIIVEKRKTKVGLRKVEE